MADRPTPSSSKAKKPEKISKELKQKMSELDAILRDDIKIDECFAGASHAVRDKLRTQALAMRAELTRAEVNMDDDNKDDVFLMYLVRHVNRIILQQLEA